MSEQSFTPPKRFRPFQADKGPWLIWSYHWNCWHRRDSQGHAAGYTDDLAHAGVFGADIARAYHDTGPKKHRRDVSVPASKVAGAMAAQLAKMTAARDAFAERLAAISQAEGRDHG